MAQRGKVVYTARIRTTGGRDNGTSRSSDGSLDIRLSTPGSVRFGTNPEQLLAAAWSAGFERAIVQVARKKKINLPADVVIETEVDLILSEADYFLRARFSVRLPGLKRDVADALVNEAQQRCPYSEAMRGNIDATFRLLSADKEEKSDD
jgi:lipoyl-dependent peroxiredoxin